jgi:hypothetical protein
VKVLLIKKEKGDYFPELGEPSLGLKRPAMMGNARAAGKKLRPMHRVRQLTKSESINRSRSEKIKSTRPIAIRIFLSGQMDCSMKKFPNVFPKYFFRAANFFPKKFSTNFPEMFSRNLFNFFSR